LIAARFPIEWAFYLDALTFLVSGALIAFIKIPTLAADLETSLASVVHNLQTGLKFIYSSPSLRSMFLIFVPVFLIFGLQNTLFLPFALRALKATEFEFGLQQAVEAVGIAAGSLLMLRYAEWLPEGQWLTISFLLMGLQSIWYSTANSVTLAIGLVGLSGVLNAPSYIARQLIIQRQCPREARGRVNSAFFVVRDLMFLGGMALAGLADFIDVRQLFFISSVALLAVALIVPFLPGLSQSVAEWRRSLGLLKGAASLPAVGPGRPATLSDLESLGRHLSTLSVLSQAELRSLAAASQVLDAPAGTRLVQQGDTSDAGYFVLTGRTAAGRREGNGYRMLERHTPGDFFGEIAAITGSPRTADVIAEMPTRVLRVPAPDLLKLTDHPEFNELFLARMRDRLISLNMLDLRGLGIIDQSLLRELRSETPD
jgi:CRP-like cAMP-binding protein